MKKVFKVFVLLLICSCCFYFAYWLLSLTSLDKDNIMFISYIFYFSPILIYFFVIKKNIKQDNDYVTKLSSKIQDVIKVNDKYEFKKIECKKRSISQREYSRKSLDRIKAYEVFAYNMDNNIRFLRDDVENAIYNINLLDQYNKEINEIIERESENNSKYSLKKYKRIEKRVLNELIHKKKEFLMELVICVYYQSNGGNVNDKRRSYYSFDEIVNMYNHWKKCRKYSETIKQERKIMNDDIRYNVLKRDNFTCCLCGATSKDGAKLHVDHIIPVSKGGKTNMSNLQTLCERCNMGKSNKNDDICPECGGNLVLKKGKYGSFIGCSNFPKCHYKKKI